MSFSSSFQVGEVKIPEDSDFRSFKSLCDEHDGWKLEVNKNSTMVWTKANELSSFKMVKVRCVYEDIESHIIYDVLHDPEYRKTWDRTMNQGAEICAINPNNDIGYYEIRSPVPLRNRDFVTQRSWLDCGHEKIIFNHSVNHSTRPVRKNVIRGISYLTGYHILKLGDRKTQLTYVSQSDPKGNLPAWAINKLTKIIAPKVMARIHKAAKSYHSWKSKNQPEYKPWLNPEQMMANLPRFNPADIYVEEKLSASTECIEEGELNEEDFKEEDY